MRTFSHNRLKFSNSKRRGIPVFCSKSFGRSIREYQIDFGAWHSAPIHAAPEPAHPVLGLAIVQVFYVPRLI